MIRPRHGGCSRNRTGGWRRLNRPPSRPASVATAPPRHRDPEDHFSTQTACFAVATAQSDRHSATLLLLASSSLLVQAPLAAGSIRMNAKVLCPTPVPVAPATGSENGAAGCFLSGFG